MYGQVQLRDLIEINDKIRYAPLKHLSKYICIKKTIIQLHDSKHFIFASRSYQYSMVGSISLMTAISMVTVTIPIVMMTMTIVVITISIVVFIVIAVAMLVVIAVAVLVVIAIRSMLGSISFIYQVDITEIPVAVLATITIFVVSRVTGSRSTRLLIAVAIGAEHKGRVILEVQTVIATLTTIFAMVNMCTIASIVTVLLVV